MVAKDAQGNTVVYMLKVDDLAKLQTAVDAIWKDPKYAKWTTDEDRIKAIHANQAEKFNKSKGQIEKSFLEQFPTGGFSIYKADATISNFSKLTLNSGVVTPDPCK